MIEEEKGEASKGDEGGENSKLEKLTSAISNKIEQMENEFKKVFFVVGYFTINMRFSI